APSRPSFAGQRETRPSVPASPRPKPSPPCTLRHAPRKAPPARPASSPHPESSVHQSYVVVVRLSTRSMITSRSRSKMLYITLTFPTLTLHCVHALSFFVPGGRGLVDNASIAAETRRRSSAGSASRSLRT